MRGWLRSNMRARWPLVSLFIGVVFALIMFLLESAGRSGGWWPDDSLRQLLVSLSAGAIAGLALAVVVLIAKRIGGRVG